MWLRVVPSTEGIVWASTKFSRQSSVDCKAQNSPRISSDPRSLCFSQVPSKQALGKGLMAPALPQECLLLSVCNVATSWAASVLVHAQGTTELWGMQKDRQTLGVRQKDRQTFFVDANSSKSTFFRRETEAWIKKEGRKARGTGADWVCSAGTPPPAVRPHCSCELGHQTHHCSPLTPCGPGAS